jgi:hypothetical protein
MCQGLRKMLVSLRSALFWKIHVLRPSRIGFIVASSRQERNVGHSPSGCFTASCVGQRPRTRAKVEVAVQVQCDLIVAKLRNQQFFSLWN